jgi:hypothetical protein
VYAVQQQHDMFNDHDQPMQQHQQHIQPPEWHPRLFGLKGTKRAALEHSARLYYDEVWGHGCTDLLDELADSGVCFNDALGMEADAFSRASLKSIIQDFQASHPLLKYELVSARAGGNQGQQMQLGHCVQQTTSLAAVAAWQTTNRRFV